MMRILWNSLPDGSKDEKGANGGIDEIVVEHPAMVHIEQMDARCWWIGITMPDGSSWDGNFVCDSRGRMRFVEQEDAGMAWDEDQVH